MTRGYINNASRGWTTDNCNIDATATTVQTMRARAALGDLLAVEKLVASARDDDHHAIKALVELTRNATPFHCAVALSHPAYGLTTVGEVAQESLLALVADPLVTLATNARIRGYAYQLYAQMRDAGTATGQGPIGMPDALLYLAGRHAHCFGPKSDYDRINAQFQARLAHVDPEFGDAGTDVLCATRCLTDREVMLTGRALRHTTLHPAIFELPSSDITEVMRDRQIERIFASLRESSRDPAALLLVAVRQDGNWGVAAFRNNADGTIDPFLFGTVEAWHASLGVAFPKDIPAASGPISALFMRDFDFRVGEYEGRQPFPVPNGFAEWIVRWSNYSVQQREAMLEVERARILARGLRQPIADGAAAAAAPAPFRVRL